LQKRIGRLIGGSAILKVGGKTESEIQLRKLVGERAVLTLKNALEGGVVLGGGTAFVQCQTALENDDLDVTEEDKAARRILSRGLEAPLRAIAINAGFGPDIIVDRVKNAPANFGFDARSGKIVDMKNAGIVDALKVIDKALQVAVSGAAMALTTDIIVHRKMPPEKMEP
jgi:chaperonin GroEL